MPTIRGLFDASQDLDRHIEKVIYFGSADNDQLKREITEYIVTESINHNLEFLLERLNEGLSGDTSEIGVWVSGFYGSGKSSFAKYLGFALDQERRVDGKPFLEWLQGRLNAQPTRALLGAVARRYPAAVVMLDLASEQIAGATMAEISSVLYWKVMQWAGYPKDAKLAQLQLMLERDGKMPEFEQRFRELARGKGWGEMKNQTLVAMPHASRIAAALYPEIYPDAASFANLRTSEVAVENERVAEMIALVRRKSGHENVIFILDEVGQYIAARDSLILNLDGLAKNIKAAGGGKAWLIATAQQTLTEDDPRAQVNSAKLFKLADRFPLKIDLEASDIKEICHRRLLTKSPAGRQELERLFDSQGASLRHHTRLQGTTLYKSEPDKQTFSELYPFLPQHFDILLDLLARLAKTSGGIGLRSAIKVIQDVMVDKSGLRHGESLLADQPVGTLATAEVFYDTLRRDIQRAFHHLNDGVDRVVKVYGAGFMHIRVAKAIAVLQVLDKFPTTRDNLAALLYPAVGSPSLLSEVRAAVDDLLKSSEVHLSEVDGRLQFMSEAVFEIEKERIAINAGMRETRQELQERLKAVFNPLPSARLASTRTVASGLKYATGSVLHALGGDRDPVQIVVELVDGTQYDLQKDARILESNQRGNEQLIYLLARDDAAIDATLAEIVRSVDIWKMHRDRTIGDQEVRDYLNGQSQQAERLRGNVEQSLRRALEAGSFIFRGKPVAVAELDADLLKAAGRQLETAAAAVFSKYDEAPLAAESGLAERFLNTSNLAQIASRDDPLGLVKKSGGRASIDSSHRALTSLKDYLDRYGQVEGRKLLDDFYDAPYGWAKDTTRYLVAALLVAGELKLRIAGADVTVRGDTATDALKNTNSFNKIGISLREGRPSPESLIRAADRLLRLTAENVLPMEDEISKAVLARFPNLQRSYAPLSALLRAHHLRGAERGEQMQDSLTEILRGDASGATPVLGSEACPLFDDLMWAREVRRVFDNEAGAAVMRAWRCLGDIAFLPGAGAPGDLKTATEPLRAELEELLGRDDFHQHLSTLRTRLSSVEAAVRDGVSAVTAEQHGFVAREAEALQSSPEWTRLGQEDQARLGAEMDALKITRSGDLDGLARLITHQYELTARLEQIKSAVRKLAAPRVEPGPVDGPKDGALDVALPPQIRSRAELEDLIEQLQALQSQIEQYTVIRFRWN